ncbi:nucleotide sugar dehydrogenase [Patescibacteria group bacterium]
MDLLEKIKSKKVTVGVVGLGYVGLPLAVEFAKVGLKVIGFDVQKEKIDLVNKGESYIGDVKNKELKKVVDSKNLKATTDVKLLESVDAVCICVPTPLDKHGQPDISYVKASTEQVAKHLQRGQLVILESTTYPGTTREIILPILEKKDGKVGKDFYLAFSPERVDPGNKKYHTGNTPKVVGGMTPKCNQLAAELYKTFNPKIHTVSSPDIAEAEKILENTFRIVNVSMINEFALLCDRLNIDVWEVIDAAATKPYGFMPFYPGPGIGGHCIPIDPFYLTWKAKEVDFYPRFIELAGEINSMMPHYTMTKVNYALNKVKKPLRGSKVLVLGVAYKKDISDYRESPALNVIKLLKHKGCDVEYHDPYVPEFNDAHGTGLKMKSIPELTKEKLAEADCVVITTDHSDYDWNMILDSAQLIVDTRNVIKDRTNDKVYRF